MTAIETATIALIAIGVGLALGNMLFKKAGDSSRTVSTAIGTMTGTFWVIVGIFMIIGGFHVGGILVVMVAYYLARGNYREYTRERGARARIAGSN